MARRLRVQKKPRAPTFTPFGRLPVELRDKIWFLALPGHGRIIEIFFEQNPLPADSSADPPATYIMKVTSPTKPPDILFVNQESALETKRHYKPLNLGPGFSFPEEILVDFSIDSIYLSCVANPFPVREQARDPTPLGCTIDISQSPQRYRFKTLAIDITIWPHLSFSFLKTYPNLTSITASFQKTSLHDIKPASTSETLTFMPKSLYFSENNWYTKGLFAADNGRIRIKSDNLSDRAWFVIYSSMGEEDKGFWAIKGSKKIEETWKSLFKATSTIREIEVEGRIIDLHWAVALYPRERMFDSLKPRFLLPVV